MVNTSKLKLTNLQQNILRLLYVKTGMSLNARRISTLLKVSQPAVSKALPLLKKEGSVKISKDKDSKQFSIELNRENHQVVWLKRADNFKQVYESGLVQFLYETFPSATIILFGSYSFGEDTINSDIDLAVIGAKQKEINLGKFENIFERAIFIHYYKDFKIINKNLLNNICNGIVLKGAIEL